MAIGGSVANVRGNYLGRARRLAAIHPDRGGASRTHPRAGGDGEGTRVWGGMVGGGGGGLASECSQLQENQTESSVTGPGGALPGEGFYLSAFVYVCVCGCVYSCMR